MDWVPWVKVLHIAGAATWIGGGVMLSLIALRARQNGNSQAVTDFAHLLSYAGLRVFMPSVVVVLLTGILMVVGGSAWNFGQLWILLALAGFAVAFLIGA